MHKLTASPPQPHSSSSLLSPPKTPSPLKSNEGSPRLKGHRRNQSMVPSYAHVSASLAEFNRLEVSATWTTRFTDWAQRHFPSTPIVFTDSPAPLPQHLSAEHPIDSIHTILDSLDPISIRLNQLLSLFLSPQFNAPELLSSLRQDSSSFLTPERFKSDESKLVISFLCSGIDRQLRLASPDAPFSDRASTWMIQFLRHALSGDIPQKACDDLSKLFE